MADYRNKTMTTKPNPIQITTSGSFDDRIDILFRELELAIRWKRPSILLAICKSENTHHEVESILKKRLLALGQDVHSFRIDEVEQADVPQYLTNLPHLEQKVVFMEGFSQGGSKKNKHAFKALNSGRDYFINRQVRVVFWLSAEEANELAHHAPEFWGYRHRVVEFMENMDANRSPLRSLGSIWQGIGEFTDAHEDIDNKIALRDSMLAELPTKSESTSSRANLLISLGVLHFRKGDVHKAISYSQTAIKLASKIEDKWFEAMCKNTLALIQANTGQVSEAIDTLKQATDLAPDQIFPWNNMGNLLNELDRLDEAMEAFHAAMQFNPVDPFCLNGLGNTYFKLGRTDDAYKNYQQAIQVAPSFAHAWNGLGSIFAKVEQIESAISAFQKAIELDDHMATPWINLGSIYEKLNRNDEATEAFRKAYELDPSNSIVWMEQGKVYFNTGCIDEAVCAFQKSIELDHGNGWSYCNLAQTYVCKGKYTEAIQLYHQSLKLFTSNSDKAITWSKLAKVYQQKNDLENAINAKMIALELDPDNEQLKKELFEIHNSLKDKTLSRNEGVSEFQPSNTLDIPKFLKDSCSEPAPSLPRPTKEGMHTSIIGKVDDPKNLKSAFEWNEYGNALLKAGSIDEARQAYKKAIEMDARFGWAHGNLALIEFNKGNYSEAAEVYQKSIKMLKTRKEKVVVLNRLGITYRKMNDFLKAIQTHRKALDLIPGDISTWQNLIQIHNNLGKLRSGIEMLTPSLDKASAWNLLGNAYRRLSDYPSALEVLKKAADMSPSDNAYKFDLEETKRESRKKISASGNSETEGNPIDIGRIKKSLNKSEQAAFVDRGEPGPLGELVSLATDKEEQALNNEMRVETELEPQPELRLSEKDSNQMSKKKQSPNSQIAGAKYRNMWHLEENLNPSEEKRVAMPMESLNPALLVYHRAAELVSAQPGRGAFVDDMVPAGLPEVSETISAPYVITSRHPKSINFFLGKNAQTPESNNHTTDQTKVAASSPAPLRKFAREAAIPEKVESGRFQKDIDTYKTVTRINPKNGRAWYTLGKLQWAAEQYEAATASLETAVELDPQQEVYQYQLGLLYARQFRYEDAVESLKKVVGITPGYSLAHAHLAMYCKKLGKNKESQNHLEIANESIQKEDEYNQACFASIAGNCEKAVELLKKSLKENQTSLDWISRDHDFDAIRAEDNFKVLTAG
jgi:tetratricopeptide (TPR) repeat protein